MTYRLDRRVRPLHDAPLPLTQHSHRARGGQESCRRGKIVVSGRQSFHPFPRYPHSRSAGCGLAFPNSRHQRERAPHGSPSLGRAAHGDAQSWSGLGDQQQHRHGRAVVRGLCAALKRPRRKVVSRLEERVGGASCWSECSIPSLEEAQHSFISFPLLGLPESH